MPKQEQNMTNEEILNRVSEMPPDSQKKFVSELVRSTNGVVSYADRNNFMLWPTEVLEVLRATPEQFNAAFEAVTK